jgi:hypothetical protein
MHNFLDKQRISIELIETIKAKFTEVEVYLTNDGKSVLTRSFTTRGGKKINPERVILRAHRHASFLADCLDIETYNIRQVDKRVKKKA